MSFCQLVTLQLGGPVIYGSAEKGNQLHPPTPSVSVPLFLFLFLPLSFPDRTAFFWKDLGFLWSSDPLLHKHNQVVWLGSHLRWRSHHDRVVTRGKRGHIRGGSKGFMAKRRGSKQSVHFFFFREGEFEWMCASHKEMEGGGA